MLRAFLDLLFMLFTGEGFSKTLASLRRNLFCSMQRIEESNGFVYSNKYAEFKF